MKPRTNTRTITRMVTNEKVITTTIDMTQIWIIVRIKSTRILDFTNRYVLSEENNW